MGGCVFVCILCAHRERFVLCCGFGGCVCWTVFTNGDQPINRGYKSVFRNWRYTEIDTEEKTNIIIINKNKSNNYNDNYNVALKTYSVLAAGLFQLFIFKICAYTQWRSHNIIGTWTNMTCEFVWFSDCFSCFCGFIFLRNGETKKTFD